MFAAAGVFVGRFAPSVGEVPLRIGLAVVLQDPVAGAAPKLGRAEVVAHADSSHPCDGQSLVLGHVNHLVHGREHHHATQAVLEILCERIAEHGAETEPDGEYARGVHAEVLVQVGEEFVEEEVVLVVAAPPRIFLAVLVGVAVRCHEDGVFLGARLVA